MISLQLCTCDNYDPAPTECNATACEFDGMIKEGLPLIRVCLFILRPNHPWSPAPPTVITINGKPSTCLLATLARQALFNVLAQRAARIGKAARS
ncbi:hypothetical protein INS49_011677 [Diaporthe citri]|uniref:uncharacterized protein n=1 Tax=Diaporthe citri TaxID=83186 RepID=UPI001C7F66A9|nr:uncharacterized protein INS49_011677 [Diaporthe citri]KAG6360613.1 hypothetical protein INS49_011677 [Diaporthe citri]